MKYTINAAMAIAVSTLFAVPALAHEPKAVDGGWTGWIMHQLTETDHMIAIMAAIVLGIGIYTFKKAKAANKTD